MGEEYMKLCEHIRKAQEAAAMLAHLNNTDTARKVTAKGWLAISEQMKLMLHQVTLIAQGNLQ